MNRYCKALGTCALLGLVGYVIALAAPLVKGQPQHFLTPAGPVVICDFRVPIKSLPFTIASPGSYVLQRDLTGVSGSDGITIMASDVTIDLNGFRLQGVPGSLSAIHAPLGTTNVSVSNGTLRGWGRFGINADSSDNWVLDGLRIFENGSGATDGGVYLRHRARITDCTVDLNQGTGIELQDGAIVSYCQIRNNLGGIGGVVLRKTCAVFDCYVSGNGDQQIYLDGFGSYCRDNVAVAGGSGSAAIRLSSAGDNCFVRENLCVTGTAGTTGIVSESQNSHITGNTVLNDTAIVLGSGSSSNVVVLNDTYGSAIGIINNGSGNKVGPAAAINNDWSNL